jgi:hypothetical protein
MTTADHACATANMFSKSIETIQQSDSTKQVCVGLVSLPTAVFFAENTEFTVIYWSLKSLSLQMSAQVAQKSAQVAEKSKEVASQVAEKSKVVANQGLDLLETLGIFKHARFCDFAFPLSVSFLRIEFQEAH